MNWPAFKGDKKGGPYTMLIVKNTSETFGLKMMEQKGRKWELNNK